MLVRTAPLAVLALFLAFLPALSKVAELPAVQPSDLRDPAILAVTVIPATVKLGSPVTATVLTTPDVVSVQGHVAAFNFNIPKTGEGAFSGTTTVPRWAIFFHGLFKVRFVAKTSTGEQTQAESSVKI